MRVFSSVRLAIALLFILVGVMVVGTLVPQHQTLGRYIGLYGKYVGRTITFLGLNDAFHSVLFNALMALFGLNLLVCSLNRAKLLRKVLFDPQVVKERERIDSLEDSRVFSPEKGSAEGLIERATNLLRRKNYTLFSKEEDGKRYLLFQKGKWGRLGPEVVHLSLIVILLGGIISGLAGFSTTLEVAEGERTEVPRTDKTLKLKDFSLEYYDDRYRLDLYKPAGGSYQHDRQMVLETGETKSYGDLSLLIRRPEGTDSGSGNPLFVARAGEDEKVLEFTGERREVMLPGNVGSILSRFHKQYRSEVEILDSGGNSVEEAKVEVNSPLTVDGVKLYQQAYELGSEEVPQAEWVRLGAFEGSGGEGSPVWEGRISLGEEVEVTEGTTVAASKFYPNLVIGEDGTPVNRSDAPENPSVYLEVKSSRGEGDPNSEEGDLSRWIFQQYGDIHYGTVAGEDSEALRFRLTDFGPVVDAGDKSVFQVSTTPGINLVYSGFGVLLLGLALSFFVFHRRIWIVLDENDGEISVGGKSNKEIHSFSEDLEELYDELEGGTK